MKKMLSCILAGALAFTAISPAFAAVDSYMTAANTYFNVDYSQANVADGESLLEFTNSVAPNEFYINTTAGKDYWMNDKASIVAATDPIMGKVAKLTVNAGSDVQFTIPRTNYKNVTTTGGNYGSTILEFSFKPITQNSSFGYRNVTAWEGWVYIFNPDGTATMARRGSTHSTTIKQNEWNHVVIEMYPYWKNASRPQDACIELWVNGEQIANDSASNFFAALNNKSETDTWNSQLYFNGNAGEFLFANFTKYETPVNNAYNPANAGDVAPIPTVLDTSVVELIGDSYSCGATTTVAQFMKAVSVGNDEQMFILEGGEGLADEDVLADYPEAKLYTVSKSGSAVKSFSIVQGSEDDVIAIDWDDAVTVDDSASTIKVSAANATTGTDFNTLWTSDNESTVAFVNASGVEVDASTALADVAKIRTYSKSKDNYKDYTLVYRAASKTYLDADFENYTDGDANAYFKASQNGVTIAPERFEYAKLEAIMDEEKGHKVAFLNANGGKVSGWHGWRYPGINNNDIELGDKLIVEASIKATIANGETGGPSFRIETIGTPEVEMFHNVAPFDFSYAHVRSGIETMNGTVPYVPNKWYHIVTELTPGTGSGTVKTWVDGVPVTGLGEVREFSNVTVATLGSNAAAISALEMTTDTYIDKFSIRRTTAGYDPAAEGDLATISVSGSDFTIKEDGKTIEFLGAKKVAELSAVLVTEGGATVTFLKADGTEADADTSLADVDKIVVRSASKDVVKVYKPQNNNLTSGVYTIDGTVIKGVLQFTINDEAFKNAFTPYGEMVISKTADYVTENDTITVDGKVYTIELDKGSHHKGDDVGVSGTINITPNEVFRRDIEFVASDDPLKIADDPDGVNYVIKKTGSNPFRPLPEYVAGVVSDNGNYSAVFVPGETRNYEFSIKSTGPMYADLQLKDRVVFSITEDNVIHADARGQGRDIVLENAPAFKYNEWMHVAVSVQCIESGNYNEKLYINGELVYDGPTVDNPLYETADAATQMNILTTDANTIIYLDDVKMYKAGSNNFDMATKYGDFDITSNTDTVRVSTNEVWFTNTDNGIWDENGLDEAKVLDANGNTGNIDGTIEGEVFYVRDATSAIIKKYTVRYGACEVKLGEDADGNAAAVATIGMFKNDRQPAVFVAGMDASGKPTSIFKVKKAHANDETITVALDDTNAGNVTVYVWDKDLTALIKPVNFVKTEGEWNIAE